MNTRQLFTHIAIVVACFVLVQADSPLSVSLFSYIPDFKNFAKRVNDEYPGALVDADKGSNYKVDDLVSDLDKFDIVEIDALFLGALVARGAIQPVDPTWLNMGGSGLLGSARQASAVGGTVYGVPHWSCGMFVHTTASTIQDALKLPFDCTDLDIHNDKWATPSAYVDQLLEANPSTQLSPNSLPSLDGVTMASPQLARLKTLVDKCNYNTTITPNSPFTSIGYHEKLRTISEAKVDINKLLVVPLASLFTGSNVARTAFTDVLVISKRCTDACLSKAKGFIQYLNKPETYKWALLNQDNSTSPLTRYLIPAYLDVLAADEFKNDRLYKNLQSYVLNSHPMPNAVVPDPRTTFTDYNNQLQKLMATSGARTAPVTHPEL